jgi:hypothetical protein
MYTVIDCSTDLIYGPYETLKQAYSHTEEFDTWEIVNDDDNLVDWCHDVSAN